jgi:hypothetical protein
VPRVEIPKVDLAEYDRMLGKVVGL